MNEAEQKIEEIFNSIKDENKRKLFFRIGMAMINGTNRDRDEIYEAILNHISIEDIIPIIERTEAG